MFLPIALYIRWYRGYMSQRQVAYEMGGKGKRGAMSSSELPWRSRPTRITRPPASVLPTFGSLTLFFDLATPLIAMSHRSTQ